MVRARCGCTQRREAERAGHTGHALRVLLEGADDFAREWRCPCAGHPPQDLPAELRAMAEHTARIVGLDEVPTTCPFACLMRADPWVAELSDAAAIAETYHTPLPDVLGRPLTRADTDALGEILRGRADAWESDRAIQEQEQAARKT